ncbi:low affinity immunoglobulin epsilon Fc receptor isoform X2 [Sciurus carolinensis]|uniref:low affinity immunoglobulin epsilon Fc receptor isoform X2 n=1 Tax=Sciurus carolinensis TaxID=30640 RepID=UPI001FB363C8|nr:low affinity immunoglobulin epsilon Fc receptor isoform X2 [Sciurus carolinensis]
MEGRRYAGFSEPPRKRCCRQRLLLVLLGMLTTALWAGLLTLLLLWHWDTMRTLRQLEDSAARNVSQVSRDLHRYQSDQMAQKSQAAQLSRNMQELRARQKQMESQDSELSWNLDRLLADLSDTKSQSLNQRRAASDSLEKLQEEVEKLRIQILVSKGSACNTCPEQWLHFQQKCYYFGKGAKRWVQARFTCSDLEGRLVSIHSQEEQSSSLCCPTGLPDQACQQEGLLDWPPGPGPGGGVYLDGWEPRGLQQLEPGGAQQPGPGRGLRDDAGLGQVERRLLPQPAGRLGVRAAGHLRATGPLSLRGPVRTCSPTWALRDPCPTLWALPTLITGSRAQSGAQRTPSKAGGPHDSLPQNNPSSLPSVPQRACPLLFD